MHVLSKYQAELMFRETDRLLLDYSFDPIENTSMDGDAMQILRFFHANEVYQLNLDDDYFKGIRANTFCIEVGWSELYSVYRNGAETYPALYLVTANHKGTRMITMWAVEEGG